jgi:hypothetical protein
MRDSTARCDRHQDSSSWGASRCVACRRMSLTDIDRNSCMNALIVRGHPVGGRVGGTALAFLCGIYRLLWGALRMSGGHGPRIDPDRKGLSAGPRVASVQRLRA